MPDFPIDPELRIRASPPIVLRRTTEAVDFIRKVALSTPTAHGKTYCRALKPPGTSGVRFKPSSRVQAAR
jgi:hypothetical protein